MKIPTDKIKHFSACFMVSATAGVIESVSGANYWQSFLAGMTAGLAISVGKEYGDKCAANRWDWFDIMSDAIGYLMGSTVGAFVSLV